VREFSVLTWNVQGRRLLVDTPFTNIMPFLETSPAEIVCLQEIPNAHRKLSLLKYFGQYHLVLSKLNNAHPLDQHNHTVILSKYPVIAQGEIDYRSIKTAKPLERTTWADLMVHDRPVRIYNCHLGVVKIGIPERQQQLKIILAHAEQVSEQPTIICGDMNTCIPAQGLRRLIIKKFHDIPEKSFCHDGRVYPDDERTIFPKAVLNKGFCDVSDPKQTTWSLPKVRIELLKLKLDWFFIKNMGVKKLDYGPYISDHRPLFAQCRF